MKKIIKFSIVLFILVIAGKSYGQQEYTITQYMYNALPLNPAYAGIHKGVSVSGLWREQWTAIAGAPSTQFISIHSPLSHRYASIGAVLFKDTRGVKTEYTGYLSYAYRIRVSEKSQLSFGLQLNMHNFSNDIARLENQTGLLQNTDRTDPLFQAFANDELGFKFNFGTGVLLHSDRYYLGASIPRLINSNFFEGLDTSIESPRLLRHLFVSGGYIINTKSNLVLKPNFLFKAVQNAPVEFDLNLNALLAKVLWLGVSFRSELSQSDQKLAGPVESIAGLVGLQINPQLLIGYSYDFTTTSISTNTHEIIVNYVFNLPTNKILTPRYF